MEIKQLPSDNLYKFVTIFCIAIILSGAYAFVNVYDSHLREYQQAKLQFIGLITDKEQSTEQTEKISYLKSQISRIESDKKFFLKMIGIAIAFGLAGAVWGFSRWKKNLQVHLDRKILYETLILRRELKRKK